MDNNNKEVTPREFKVGDVVWDCATFGKGVITEINNSDKYPITVEDKNGYEYSYLPDGRYDDDAEIRTLYHQPYRIELLDIPEELPEVGTPVYVWGKHSTQCKLRFFVGKLKGMYAASDYFPIKETDAYLYQFMSLTLPDKFK